VPSKRLCFVGDSFVQGCGDPLMLGWVGRVCAGSSEDLTVYNLGIRGQTSGEIAARWLTEAQPRLSAQPYGQRGLVFSFGANDAAQNIPLERTTANTEAILGQATSMAPTLLIGPAPIADSPSTDPRLNTMSQLMADCASRHGVAFLPIFTALRQNPIWMEEALSGDGAHPGAGGYSALADLVRSWPAWQDWFR